MRKSKLDIYVVILEALAHEEPLKMTEITCRINMGRGPLKYYLDSLTHNELVKKNSSYTKHTVYTITESGKILLRSFKKVSHIFLMT